MSPPRGYYHEGVFPHYAGPTRGNRHHLALRIIEKDAVLPPVVATLHQLKLALEEGMKRVSYSKTSYITVSMRCS
jgi:hypothetical protein